MAISDAYATAVEARGRWKMTSDSEDEQINSCLLACTFVLNREAKMSATGFNRDAVVVNRYYYPPVTSRTLNVDPIADTAGLVIKVNNKADGSFANETAFASTDYQLLPLNAAPGPEDEPWTQIYIPYWSTQPWWSPFLQVQVTAIWGWPSVPAAVKEDTIRLCGIWLRKDPGATGHINELDQVVSESPLAMSLVTRFKNAYRGRVTV